MELESVCGEPISKANPIIRGENPVGFQKYLRNHVLENMVA